MKEISAPYAAPFIKWAGGKSQILPWIEKMLPRQIGNYFEPFIGGGAVFFKLASQGTVARSFLCDANPHLVTTYRVVRDEPESLIKYLDELKLRNSDEYFYQARNRFNHEQMSDVERAALLIYLNKTCFNGLFRVNSKGHFNVPVGRYVNPGIYDAQQIQACSAALKHAEIECGDFESILTDVGPGDFVYFDPPYVPLTKTAHFTSYARDDFTFDDQVRLSNVFKRLSEVGARVLLSNHATPELISLYDGFDISIVPARRMINRDASRRMAPIDEVLIRNY
ncbi:MAG TPA: DNA adenine methylase [Myxococcota bacterium]|nr:DNA adenine methylase [Myxococcota bacterium]